MRGGPVVWLRLLHVGAVKPFAFGALRQMPAVPVLQQGAEILVAPLFVFADVGASLQSDCASALSCKSSRCLQNYLIVQRTDVSVCHRSANMAFGISEPVGLFLSAALRFR